MDFQAIKKYQESLLQKALGELKSIELSMDKLKLDKTQQEKEIARIIGAIQTTKELGEQYQAEIDGQSKETAKENNDGREHSE
jgi:hypothetical protein